jgi:hypothetical protein
MSKTLSKPIRSALRRRETYDRRGVQAEHAASDKSKQYRPLGCRK